MRKIWILTYIYFGIVIASLLIYYFGNEGFFSYKKLQEHKIEMEKNINDLQTINKSLEAKLSMLKTDPDTNKVEARKMGYIDDNEVLIQMDGYESESNFYTIGRILKYRFADRDINNSFKMVGLGVTLLFIFLHLLLYLKRRRLGSDNQRK